MKRIDRFLRKPHDPNIVHTLTNTSDGLVAEDVAPGNTITVRSPINQQNRTINKLPLKGMLRQGCYHTLYRHADRWEVVSGINHRPELQDFKIDTFDGSYRNGVLMRDGRLLLLCAVDGVLHIYDYRDNSIKRISTGRITVTGIHRKDYFASGCLLKDGRVILAPYYADAWYVYDPKEDKLIREKSISTVTGEEIEGSVFYSPTYMDASCSNEEGYAIFGPTLKNYDMIDKNHTYWHVVIRDPNGKYTKTDIGINVDQITALPDGRFALFNYSNKKESIIYLINPKTLSYKTVTIDPNTYGSRTESVTLLPDNRTLLVLLNSGYSYYFDIEKGTVRKGSKINNKASLEDANLLPDGNLGIITYAGGEYIIYDPYLDRIVKEYRFVPKEDARENPTSFRTSILLPSGQVFVCGESRSKTDKPRLLTIPEISPAPAEFITYVSRG